MNDLLKTLLFAYGFLRKRLIHLNLQILYQCNFRCSICNFWKEPYNRMPIMTASDVRTISEKLRKIGPQIVSIGGGEPLLHPHLPEIVQALAVHHFPVMICNGWYVTQQMAHDLFKAGLYEISISLDYADPAKHDQQRGMPGAYEHAREALTILHENRVAPHQRVHMISVIMDDNLDEIEPLIQLAQKMGVTYLVTLHSHGRGSKTSRNPQRDVSSHLLRLRRKYPGFVALPGYLSRFTEASTTKNGVTPCYAGKNLFNIDCQGNVTRCIDCLDKVAGNIFTDDLDSIQKTLLRQFSENDCGSCWTSCRGNIETLMYGPGRLASLIDSHRVTKPIPLRRNIVDHGSCIPR